MAVSRLVIVGAIVALVAGCATTPPLDTSGVDRTITPSAAAYHPARFSGHQVLWAGTIVQATNLRHRTQLQVLGYPLDGSLGPDTAAKPQRRFLVEKAGYLETVDFAPGREITVVGTLHGVSQGKVGQAPYTFPVVKARQLYLWPTRSPARRSNVHFGVGVGVGVH
ncbi:MAG TPA: Slp family lipoprotein [Gammaproteobacteria bacterium]|nr:Slp family lipoprotein [Gammaproteobacteria bacterium]